MLFPPLRNRIYSISIPLKICQKRAQKHKLITEFTLQLWHVAGTFLAYCGMAEAACYAKLTVNAFKKGGNKHEKDEKQKEMPAQIIPFCFLKIAKLDT